MRVFNSLASSRLAICLIGLLIVHLVAAAVIPQQDIAEDLATSHETLPGGSNTIVENLALDRIFYAPPFYVLLGLLSINIMAGNVRRVLTAFRAESRLSRIRSVGSFIFHFSLVVVMIGVILNYLYKFEGVFAITEGQTLSDAPEIYHRLFDGPLCLRGWRQFSITLNKVDIEYPTGGAKAVAAMLVVSPAEGPALNAVVYTNHPYRFGDYELHYGLSKGYSPKVTVWDSVGDIVFSAFVRLAVNNEAGRRTHADFVQIPAHGLRLNMKLLNDSLYAKDHLPMTITVEKDTERLYTGTVAPKDTVTFAKYRLTFDELRYWCYVDVVRVPFLWLVFTGFWMAIVGMFTGLIARLAGGSNNDG